MLSAVLHPLSRLQAKSSFTLSSTRLPNLSFKVSLHTKSHRPISTLSQPARQPSSSSTYQAISSSIRPSVSLSASKPVSPTAPQPTSSIAPSQSARSLVSLVATGTPNSTQDKVVNNSLPPSMMLQNSGLCSAKNFTASRNDCLRRGGAAAAAKSWKC